MKSILTLVLLMCSLAAMANDVNFSAEGVSVSEDGVTTFTGDVVIEVSKGVAVQVKSDRVRVEEGRQILEGNVVIVVPGQTIKSPQAIVTKRGEETVIRMDVAESTAK